MASEKIVLLRINKESVYAYISEEVDDSNLALHFRGPYAITRTKQHPAGTNATSKPIFDYRNNAILWACYGNAQFQLDIGGGGPRSTPINLWRIGQNFQLSSVQDTGLSSEILEPIGLVMHGNLVSVSCAKGKGEGLAMAQNVKDASKKEWEHGPEWTTVKSFNSTANDSAGDGSLLYRSLNDTIQLVYHLRLQQKATWSSQGWRLWIDQMGASKFEQLYSSPSNIWQTYQVECPWNDERVPTPYVTSSIAQDNSPTAPLANHLYLFRLAREKFGKGGQFTIEVAHVRLRSDGSIDSAQESLKATQVPAITAPSDPNLWATDLQVTELPYRRLLVTWRSLEGSDGGYTPHGVLTSLDTDGTLKAPWQVVSMAFDTPFSDEQFVSWSAVAVPANFVV